MAMECKTTCIEEAQQACITPGSFWSRVFGFLNKIKIDGAEDMSKIK